MARLGPPPRLSAAFPRPCAPCGQPRGRPLFLVQRDDARQLLERLEIGRPGSLRSASLGALPHLARPGGRSGLSGGRLGRREPDSGGRDQRRPGRGDRSIACISSAWAALSLRQARFGIRASRLANKDPWSAGRSPRRYAERRARTASSSWRRSPRPQLRPHPPPRSLRPRREASPPPQSIGLPARRAGPRAGLPGGERRILLVVEPGHLVGDGGQRPGGHRLAERRLMRRRSRSRPPAATRRSGVERRGKARAGERGDPRQRRGRDRPRALRSSRPSGASRAKTVSTVASFWA